MRRGIRGGGEVERSIAVPVARREIARIVSRIEADRGLEGAIAVTGQDAHPVSGDCKVHLAVSIPVADSHADAVAVDGDGRVCVAEPHGAVPRAEVDVDEVRGAAREDQVDFLVAVEVSDRDGRRVIRIDVLRRGHRRVVDRGAEGPVAHSQQDVDDVGVEGRDREIGLAVAVEVRGRDRGGVPVAGEVDRGAKRAIAVAQEDAHGGLRAIGHHEVDLAVAVEVSRCDGGDESRAVPGFGPEGAVALPEQHADPAARGGRHVHLAVAVEVGRGERKHVGGEGGLGGEREGRYLNGGIHARPARADLRGDLRGDVRGDVRGEVRGDVGGDVGGVSVTAPIARGGNIGAHIEGSVVRGRVGPRTVAAGVAAGATTAARGERDRRDHDNAPAPARKPHGNMVRHARGFCPQPVSVRAVTRGRDRLKLAAQTGHFFRRPAGPRRVYCSPTCEPPAPPSSAR